MGVEARVRDWDVAVLGVAAGPHFMQIQRFGMRLTRVIPEHFLV